MLIFGENALSKKGKEKFTFPHLPPVKKGEGELGKSDRNNSL